MAQFMRKFPPRLQASRWKGSLNEGFGIPLCLFFCTCERNVRVNEMAILPSYGTTVLGIAFKTSTFQFTGGLTYDGLRIMQ